MTKGIQPDRMHWIVVNATTAGSAFVNQAITRDPALSAKTHWVLLYEEGGHRYCRVVRDSTSEPDCYSDDRYVWSGTKWEFQRTIKGKRENLPAPPPNVYRTDLQNVPFFTQQKPTQDDVEKLKGMMPLLRWLDHPSHAKLGKQS